MVRVARAELIHPAANIQIEPPAVRRERAPRHARGAPGEAHEMLERSAGRARRPCKKIFAGLVRVYLPVILVIGVFHDHLHKLLEFAPSGGENGQER
jgi:hypothetical protein